MGNIGHEMFLLGKPFSIKHVAYNSYITPKAVAEVEVKLVDTVSLLPESDLLNINCLLNENIRHLVDEKGLRKITKTAFLINIALGLIVDEVALIKALQEGSIQGAGIDVFNQEPTLTDNHLLKLKSVITTGRGIVFTDEFLTHVWEQILRQISQIIRGELPEDLVNQEVCPNLNFNLS